MSDVPSKFQKDPSITFRVILYTHTHTQRRTNKVWEKHYLLGGGNKWTDTQVDKQTNFKTNTQRHRWPFLARGDCVNCKPIRRSWVQSPSGVQVSVAGRFITGRFIRGQFNMVGSSRGRFITRSIQHRSIHHKNCHIQL